MSRESFCRRAKLIGTLPGLRSAWIDRGKDHAPKTRRPFQELCGYQPYPPSAKLIGSWQGGGLDSQASGGVRKVVRKLALTCSAVPQTGPLLQLSR